MTTDKCTAARAALIYTWYPTAHTYTLTHTYKHTTQTKPHDSMREKRQRDRAGVCEVVREEGDIRRINKSGKRK